MHSNAARDTPRQQRGVVRGKFLRWRNSHKII
jgi:hypothetical protein